MMASHKVLLDAFSEARRSWDDLISLQPDIVAASGNLGEPQLMELERRVETHRQAIDMFADALETEPEDIPAGRLPHS
jgi:hypothetical protein